MILKYLYKINSLLKIIYSVNGIIITRFTLGFYTEFCSNKKIILLSKIYVVLTILNVSVNHIYTKEYQNISATLSLSFFAIIYFMNSTASLIIDSKWIQKYVNDLKSIRQSMVADKCFDIPISRIIMIIYQAFTLMMILVYCHYDICRHHIYLRVIEGYYAVTSVTTIVPTLVVLELMFYAIRENRKCLEKNLSKFNTSGSVDDLKKNFRNCMSNYTKLRDCLKSTDAPVKTMVSMNEV
ncbi:hypothetical protein B5X24_HaOG200981 [Helicoverpa armigera]|nr:hypothetical protein B5X24_HaOG200981 [Helicoverpa armigera]